MRRERKARSSSFRSPCAPTGASETARKKCFRPGKSRLSCPAMSGAKVIKQVLIAVTVAATGLGGYLYVTNRDKPPMAEAGVCPVTGARAHDVSAKAADSQASNEAPENGEEAKTEAN